MKKESESKTISVSITTEMKNYLDNHPNLKQSQVFQNAMFKIMNPKKNPLLLLIGVIGVCFSIVCLSISVSGVMLLFGYQGFLLSAVIFCIGCAVLVASILTFYKDRK